MHFPHATKSSLIIKGIVLFSICYIIHCALCNWMLAIAVWLGHTHAKYPRDKTLSGCVYMLTGARGSHSACSGVPIAFPGLFFPKPFAVTLCVSRFVRCFICFFVPNCVCFSNARGLCARHQLSSLISYYIKSSTLTIIGMQYAVLDTCRILCLASFGLGSK